MAIDGHLDHLLRVQRRPVGEGERLDPVHPDGPEHPGVGFHELVGDGQSLIGIIGEVDHQVVGAADPVEGQVREDNAGLERDRVELAADDVGVVVVDDVVAVARPDQIGVVAVAAGQVVVAGPAIDRVVGLVAIDMVVARGLRGMQHQVPNLLISQGGTVVEGDQLDLVAPDRAEHAGFGGRKLALDGHRIRRILETDDQVVAAVGAASEGQVVLGNAVPEGQHVDRASVGVILDVEDGVVPAVAADLIDVAATAALQHVIARPANQDIGGRGADLSSTVWQRVRRRDRHIDLFPDRAVGEDDLGDAIVRRIVAAVEPRLRAGKLLVDAQGLAGGVDGQHQVGSIARGGDVAGRQGGEPDDVVAERAQRRLDRVDHGVADVLAHHIGVGTQSALRRLARAVQIENVRTDGADHHSRTRDNHVGRDAEGGGGRNQVEAGRGRLIGGDDVLGDEPIGVQSAGCALRVVVLDDLQQRLPGGQIGDGIALAPSVLEQVLEHRRHLLVARGDELVAGHIVGDAGEHRRQRAGLDDDPRRQVADVRIETGQAEVQRLQRRSRIHRLGVERQTFSQITLEESDLGAQGLVPAQRAAGAVQHRADDDQRHDLALLHRHNSHRAVGVGVGVVDVDGAAPVHRLGFHGRGCGSMCGREGGQIRHGPAARGDNLDHGAGDKGPGRRVGAADQGILDVPGIVGGHAVVPQDREIVHARRRSGAADDGPVRQPDRRALHPVDQDGQDRGLDRRQVRRGDAG